MRFNRKPSGLFVPSAPAIITRRGFLLGAAAASVVPSVLLPTPAMAAFTLLAHTTIASAATGGTSGAINTTNANLIVWSISHVTAINPGYSDSKSNSWTQPGGAVRDGTNNAQLEWRYAINPITDSAQTFTISGGGGNSFPSACITAWRVTAGFDNASAGGATAASATVQPGSITPANSGSLILVGVEVNDNTGATGLIDSGFTFSDQVALSPATYLGNMQAYLNQGAAAAVNPTFTLSQVPLGLASQSLVFTAAPTTGNGFFHSFPP